MSINDNHKHKSKYTSKNQSTIVKLNVGGQLFTTTSTTLKAVSNSMLSAMFSGRFKLEKDTSTNSVFIDRDPTYFHHILNWLRNKTLPDLSLREIQSLIIEAEYYQLVDLQTFLAASLRKIKPPKLTNSLSDSEPPKECVLVPYADPVEQKFTVQEFLEMERCAPEEMWFRTKIKPMIHKGYKIRDLDWDSIKKFGLLLERPTNKS
mmetsp:Transcript_6452/g.7005  ORF Transcript_6452/g.7005 Transcript_6452/m.7005 type:complete len:206 (+) Transcript_6452:98-715(+)